MPPISEAINADRSNLTPVDPKTPEHTPPITDQRIESLTQSPYARCPLPPSSNSADSLRQWGQGSIVPRFRTQTPPNNLVGVTVETGGVATVGTSLASTVKTAVATAVSTAVISGATLPTMQNASITTPALAPSQTWQGLVPLAKGFLLLKTTANSFARIELYDTKIAQTLDLGRPVSQAPKNTTIGLILDVVLLTSLSWSTLDCVGSNADFPQTASIYVTVTNVSTAARIFVISFQFVPLEA